METAEHARREVWLDGLKGFAILLVILGHVLSGYMDAGTFPEAWVSFYRVRSWIYSFHMPLFFLISGFTFTLAYYSEGHLRKRGYFAQLVNLVWIYVLFALIQWAIKQLVPELVNDTYDLSDLRNMLLVPLGNFWYLYVLFVLYVLGALLRTASWSPMWVLLPGAAAIIAADIHMDWTALTGYRIIYHFAFFALGSVLCRYRSALSSKKLLGISAMILSMAAFFYVCFQTRTWYSNWRVMIAAATCFVNLFLFFRIPKLSGFPLFQICGKYCLELYLLHTFFTAGFRSVLPLLGITGPWISAAVNFILSTGICLGLAVLAGKCRWMDAVFRPSRFLGLTRKPEQSPAK